MNLYAIGLGLLAVGLVLGMVSVSAEDRPGRFEEHHPDFKKIVSEGAVVEKVEDLIEDYRDATGAAVLWVTHDPAQAQRIGSRRYRMQDGRLILERSK